MKKIIVLAFTSLFATTNFSMLQKHTAKSTTVMLQNSSPQSDLLTTKLISDPERKQKRNDKVDIILKDYNRGLVHSLAASTITGATVYLATRALPVLSKYSVSSAAWTGAHVGILTHMIHSTKTLSRLEDLKPLTISKNNSKIRLALVGALSTLTMLNLSSFALAVECAKNSADINIALIVPTAWASYIGLLCAFEMHNKINELATQIKSMPDSELDSDPSPNDDYFLCSIG